MSAASGRRAAEAYYAVLGCVCGVCCVVFGATGGAGMALAGIGILVACPALDRASWRLTKVAPPRLGSDTSRWSVVWGAIVIALTLGGWLLGLAAQSAGPSATAGVLVVVATIACGAAYEARPAARSGGVLR